MINNAAIKHIAIWLVPCDKHKSLLSKQIIRLSRKLQSPVFEPHMTIFSGKIRLSSAKQSLDYVANHFKSISVEAKTLGTEDIFTKTLYISMKNSEDLSRLSGSFDKYFLSSTFIFDPHLSLTYKNLPQSARGSLVKETEVTIKHIHFSCIRAVEAPIPSESEDDVIKWKPLFSRNLSDQT